MMSHLDWDHAPLGQVAVASAATFTGKFYGLKVTATMVIDTITWETSYAAKCTGDWSDLTNLPVGYYPGRFTSITVTSGEGILFKCE